MIAELLKFDRKGWGYRAALLPLDGGGGLLLISQRPRRRNSERKMASADWRMVSFSGVIAPGMWMADTDSIKKP